MKYVFILLLIFANAKAFDENKLYMTVGLDLGGDPIYNNGTHVYANRGSTFKFGRVDDVTDLFDINYAIGMRSFTAFMEPIAFLEMDAELLASLPIGKLFRISAGVNYYFFSEVGTRADKYTAPTPTFNNTWGKIYMIEYMMDIKGRIGSLGLSYSEASFVDSSTGQVYNGDSIGILFTMYTL